MDSMKISRVADTQNFTKVGLAMLVCPFEHPNRIEKLPSPERMGTLKSPK
jgi:hypothetical protein